MTSVLHGIHFCFNTRRLILQRPEKQAMKLLTNLTDQVPHLTIVEQRSQSISVTVHSSTSTQQRLTLLPQEFYNTDQQKLKCKTCSICISILLNCCNHVELPPFYSQRVLPSEQQGTRSVVLCWTFSNPTASCKRQWDQEAAFLYTTSTCPWELHNSSRRCYHI